MPIWPSSRLLRNSLLVCVLAAGMAWPAAAQEKSREAELTALVRQDCGSCHGMTLKGGLGGPLQPSDIAHLEADGIAQIILEGVPGKPMPPWRGLLSETDVAWIARKLKEGFPK